MSKQNILKAGKIASEIKAWIKPQIQRGTPLLEIAQAIENKIFEMEAEPAFPVNLSINEQAAHYTPRHDDESLAQGLLKVDFGVSVDGFIADTAFSVDLDNTPLNKRLIEAAQKALEEAEKILSPEITLGEIGDKIEKTISSYHLNPVANLSGHSLEQYDLHAGISIPNVNNNSTTPLGELHCAIEPFATNGNGKVHDGVKGNIYLWVEDKNTRNPKAREVLEFIKDHYGNMPFASRWIVEEFDATALLALRQLEADGILHHYAILTEEKGKFVSQAENTFLIEKNKVINTTK